MRHRRFVGVLLEVGAIWLTASGCATTKQDPFPVGRWIVRKSRDKDVPEKKQIRLEFRSNGTFVYAVTDSTGRQDRKEGRYEIPEPDKLRMKFSDGLEWEATTTDSKNGPILEFWGKGGMTDVLFCIQEPQ
jgi:hypothetical protein